MCIKTGYAKWPEAPKEFRIRGIDSSWSVRKGRIGCILIGKREKSIFPGWRNEGVKV